jgi:hypothetical protein
MRFRSDSAMRRLRPKLSLPSIRASCFLIWARSFSVWGQNRCRSWFHPFEILPDLSHFLKDFVQSTLKPRGQSDKGHLLAEGFGLGKCAVEAGRGNRGSPRA